MFIKRILALALVMSLAAPCALADVSRADTAASMLKHLIAGDYEMAMRLMNGEAKASITPEALKNGWDSVIAQFGNVKGYDSEEGKDDSESLICELENGVLRFTCVFDDDGLVKTFNLMPVSYGNQEPLPLELPEGVTEQSVKLFAGTIMELDGLVTLPKDYEPGKTPMVVMAQGSGPSDKDETIRACKPFRDIAYGLAGLGIASIRHDKMTYSHPELFTDVKNFTVDFELVDPALEALSIARQKGFENVYLLGHSLGGMMTPWVMSKAEGGFKGGIIMAGSPRKFWEIMRDQSITILEEKNDPDENAVKIAVSRVEEDAEKARELCGLTREQAVFQTDAVMGMPAYYLWSIDGIDRENLPLKNGLPLLILQGEADFQVTLEEDFKAWKDLLGDKGDIFSFKTYPGLNHLFMPAQEGLGLSQIDKAYGVPSYVDERVIADIGDWIKAR